MPIWETVRNASFRTRSKRIANAITFGTTFVRNSPASHRLDTTSEKALVGRPEQPLRDRNALDLVGVEQPRVGASGGDERELPPEVVRVLQTGVHALRADRAVDVRGVAEQKAPAVPEPRRPAMADPVHREPAARLERQSGSRFLPERGQQRVEVRSFASTKLRRHDPDQPPVIRAAHREEEMEAVAPEIDVELVRRHRAGDDGVGDEEHVLVRRPGELDPGQVAHRAVRAVASGDPLRLDFLDRAVRALELRGDALGRLCELDELGVPLHVDAPAAEGFSEQPLVVVLAEDQEKGIRAEIAPDVAEGDARRPRPSGPEIRARGALAQLERSLDDPQVGVDLEGAGLYAERPASGGTVRRGGRRSARARPGGRADSRASIRSDRRRR